MAMIGEIKLWGGQWAPVGWRFCDGSELDITWNTNALIAIIGQQYGGSGNKFALPNLAPVPDIDGRGVSRYIICLQGDFPTQP